MSGNCEESRFVTTQHTLEGRWPGLAWLMFSPMGRISREPYWLVLAGMTLIIAIFVNIWLVSIPENFLVQSEALAPSSGQVMIDFDNFISSNPLIPIFLLVLQWVIFAIAIKRLQDYNLSGFFAVLVWLPAIGTITIIILGFLPSQGDANRYGPQPNSRWLKVPRA